MPATMLPAAPVQDLTIREDRDNARLRPFYGLSVLADAFWFIEPTWRNYIRYVSMAAREGDLNAQRFVLEHSKMSYEDKRVHVPEQLCELANVPAVELRRWVLDHFVSEGSDRAAMCLSSLKDRALEKAAEFAMAAPENHQHMKMFLQAANLLPQAGQGSAPNRFINQIFSNAAASSNSIAGVKSEVRPVHGLAGMDEEIVELSKIMQTGEPNKYMPDGDDPDEDDEDDDEEES